MAEERNEQLSLEELNQQFIADIKTKTPPKKQPKMYVIVAAVIILLIIIVVCIWRLSAGSDSKAVSVTGTPDTVETEESNENDSAEVMEESSGDSALNEEELEKWQTQESAENKIYIELNTEINLVGTRAFIRLINPIYGSNTLSVAIYAKDEAGTLLYQSERLAPGTILEAVTFSQEPEVTEGTIRYTAFNDAGEEIGSHPVDVTFSIGIE